MDVIPQRVRLLGERHLCNPFGETRIVEIAEIDRAILPRSTSIIAATLVTVFVTECSGKIVSGVISIMASTSRLPNHLK